jgi:hypothetical protein
MDIEEIKDVPEFDHDIEPNLYELIPLKQRPLAETISKLRQEVRWGTQKTIIAHNLGVQTARLQQRVIYAICASAGLFLLTKLMELLTHKS